jgi:hypothetical protein
MSESETPSTPEPVDPKRLVDATAPVTPESSPFAQQSPAMPEFYPLGRPPKSPFAAETPRLGILHFLVAMTGVAICFSSGRMIDDLRRANTPADAAIAYQDVFKALGGVIAGLAMASLGFVPARWRRGERYPVWPGEWLLLSYGLTAVLTSGAMIAMETGRVNGWFSNRGEDDFGRMGWFYAGSTLFQFAVNTIAAVRVRIRPWRTYFTIAALLCLLMTGIHGTAFGMGSFRCALLADVPCLVLIVVAILGDLVQRRRLPWTHWFGAGLYASALVLSIAWLATVMFFRY